MDGSISPSHYSHATRHDLVSVERWCGRVSLGIVQLLRGCGCESKGVVVGRSWRFRVPDSDGPPRAQLVGPASKLPLGRKGRSAVSAPAPQPVTTVSPTSAVASTARGFTFFATDTYTSPPATSSLKSTSRLALTPRLRQCSGMSPDRMVSATFFPAIDPPASATYEERK
jgi:hypothetical protein